MKSERNPSRLTFERVLSLVRRRVENPNVPSSKETRQQHSGQSNRQPSGKPPRLTSRKEGDRCAVCGYWYWERDGEGWHSLVPITYADTPELANVIDWCGVCGREALGA